MNKNQLAAWLCGIFSALVHVEAADHQITQMMADWIALVNSNLGISQNTKEWSCKCFSKIVMEMSEDPSPIVQRAVARLRKVFRSS